MVHVTLSEGTRLGCRGKAAGNSDTTPRLFSTSAVIRWRKKFDAEVGLNCDDSEYVRATMYALLFGASEEGTGMHWIPRDDPSGGIGC